MTDKEVKTMLRNLSFCRGRAKTLEAAIKACEIRAKRAHDEALDAACGPKAQTISDMPHGSRRTDSTVEALAIKLADGQTLDDCEREQLRRADDHREELQRANVIIDMVTGWLEALNPQERFLLEHRTILRESWYDIENYYRVQFGVLVGRRTMMHTVDTAVGKICAMTEGVNANLW